MLIDILLGISIIAVAAYLWWFHGLVMRSLDLMNSRIQMEVKPGRGWGKRFKICRDMFARRAARSRNG